MRIKQNSSQVPFDGSFYDKDYFENGRQSGKGWLENYRWMPRRSFREAFAVIDHLGLDDKSYVLDVGCAKGFIVRALRELDIRADGCDISNYALSFAPKGCWNCSEWDKHLDFGYTHAFAKDVLEHLTIGQLDKLLQDLRNIAPVFMCVVPMGNDGVYRIPEYHTEISHIIAEDEIWWTKKFIENGWQIEKFNHHISGLKDNWQAFADGVGNCVFVLKRS